MYFKLCTEKPSKIQKNSSPLGIAYIEDPLHFDDIDGIRKLKEKFANSQVKFGSRKLYSSVEKIKESLGIVCTSFRPS